MNLYKQNYSNNLTNIGIWLFYKFGVYYCFNKSKIYLYKGLRYNTGKIFIGI